MKIKLITIFATSALIFLCLWQYAAIKFETAANRELDKIRTSTNLSFESAAIQKYSFRAIVYKPQVKDTLFAEEMHANLYPLSSKLTFSLHGDIRYKYNQTEDISQSLLFSQKCHCDKVKVTLQLAGDSLFERLQNIQNKAFELKKFRLHLNEAHIIDLQTKEELAYAKLFNLQGEMKAKARQDKKYEEIKINYQTDGLIFTENSTTWEPALKYYVLHGPINQNTDLEVELLYKDWQAFIKRLQPFELSKLPLRTSSQVREFPSCTIVVTDELTSKLFSYQGTGSVKYQKNQTLDFDLHTKGHIEKDFSRLFKQAYADYVGKDTSTIFTEQQILGMMPQWHEQGEMDYMLQGAFQAAASNEDGLEFKDMTFACRSNLYQALLKMKTEGQKIRGLLQIDHYKDFMQDLAYTMGNFATLQQIKQLPDDTITEAAKENLLQLHEQKQEQISQLLLQSQKFLEQINAPLKEKQEAEKLLLNFIYDGALDQISINGKTQEEILLLFLQNVGLFSLPSFIEQE